MTTSEERTITSNMCSVHYFGHWTYSYLVLVAYIYIYMILIDTCMLYMYAKFIKNIMLLILRK